jgi:hypothetical protein
VYTLSAGSLGDEAWSPYAAGIVIGLLQIPTTSCRPKGILLCIDGLHLPGQPGRLRAIIVWG